MNCKHEKVVVIPSYINNEDGQLRFGKLDAGEMFCQACEEPLHIEDLQFYDRKDVSIGIPTENV